jgi:nucleotide-binding universal stress UspA family protein
MPKGFKVEEEVHSYVNSPQRNYIWSDIGLASLMSLEETKYLSMEVRDKMKAFLSKILVPVDGSENSCQAMEVAAQVAKKAKAAVTVMHVIPPSFLYTKIKPTYKMSTEIRDRILRSIERDGRKVINEGQTFFANAGVVVDKNLVRFREVASSILTASDRGYDLIVMGSRGESEKDRFGPGSVAKRISRHSQIPVLIVKALCSLSSMIAGIDGSKPAINALKFGVELGKLMGSKITLINVQEHKLHEFSPETAEEMGQHILSEALNSLGKTDLKVEKKVAFGVPADTIVETAEKEGHDIIVLSRVGRGRTKFEIGGVCEHVIQKAKCSVLIVPPTKKRSARLHTH